MSYDPPRDFPDDSVNPYAAPLAELRARPDLTGMAGTIPVTVEDVYSRAWAIYKEKLGICIAIVLGAGAISLVFSIAPSLLELGLHRTGLPPVAITMISFVLTLGGAILQVWLNLGETMAILKVARGRHVEFSEVFNGGPYLLSTIGASILVGLMIFGTIIICILPAGIVAFATRGLGVAMIVTLAVGALIALLSIIMISLRVSQFVYLIVDRGVGAIESLRLSNQIARGREGQIFLIGFLGGLLNLGGAMACFVGVVFTAPLVFLALAVLYVALIGQRVGVKTLSEADFDNLA